MENPLGKEQETPGRRMEPEWESYGVVVELPARAAAGMVLPTMQTPLNFCCFIMLVFSPLCRGIDEDLKKTAEALPAKLQDLMKTHQERLDSGVTMEMVDALEAVSDGLLPALVRLEDGDEDEELMEIQRDMAGAASAIYYRNHATGWGGTITSIEMAAERLNYLETRICHAVTNAFREEDGFDLEGWHARWKAAGGSTGGSYGDEIEDEVASLRIDGEQIRIANGKSGGVCEEPAEGLAGRTLELSAKAGQKLVIAATVVRIRLLRIDTDGKAEAFSDWGRCLDARLPESKGGVYRVEFGKKAPSDDEAARLLIEIR